MFQHSKVLSLDYNMIIADAGENTLNNTNFNSATGDSSTDANEINEFAAKLNVLKNCGTGSVCLVYHAYKTSLRNRTINITKAPGLTVWAKLNLLRVQVW